MAAIDSSSYMHYGIANKVVSIATAALLALPSGAALAQGSAELDAMVKAARAEGNLTIYTIAPENVIGPFARGFNDKYGVRADYVRLSSAALGQRYAAELAAGNPAADLAFLNNADVFIQESIKKGWVQPLDESNLPALKSGDYPARFLRPGSAIVQISPYHILYNTERARGADIPRSWKSLLDPKYRGQILISDPAESDSLLDVWALLYDSYGESFFAALRAQNPRWMSGTIGAVQALGAGEGMVQFPATRAVGLIIAAKGGPVDASLPDPTTGTETNIIMTHRKLAKKPNAARLFANYYLSREGNLAYAAAGGPGTYSVYDTAGLPRQYASPKPGTAARKAELRKALGLPQ